MGFFEGFAQGYGQARDRVERKNEIILQSTLPSLIKRRDEWDERKRTDQSRKSLAATIAKDVGNPEFATEAYRRLSLGLDPEKIKQLYVNGEFVQKTSDSSVVVPKISNVDVTKAAPSGVSDAPVGISVEPITTDPSKPAVPAGVARTKKGLSQPEAMPQDTNEGPVANPKILELLKESAPDLADFYANAPDVADEMRMNEETSKDTNWTLKPNVEVRKVEDLASLNAAISDAESSGNTSLLPTLQARRTAVLRAKEEEVRIATRAESTFYTIDPKTKTMGVAVYEDSSGFYKDATGQPIVKKDVIPVSKEDSKKIFDVTATLSKDAIPLQKNQAGLVQLIKTGAMADTILRKYSDPNINPNGLDINSYAVDFAGTVRSGLRELVAGTNLVKAINENDGTIDSNATFSPEDVNKASQNILTSMQARMREAPSGQVSIETATRDADLIKQAKVLATFQIAGALYGQEGRSFTTAEFESTFNSLGNDPAKLMENLTFNIKNAESRINTMAAMLNDNPSIRQLRSTLGGYLPEDISVPMVSEAIQMSGDQEVQNYYQGITSGDLQKQAEAQSYGSNGEQKNLPPEVNEFLKKNPDGMHFDYVPNDDEVDDTKPFIFKDPADNQYKIFTPSKNK